MTNSSALRDVITIKMFPGSDVVTDCGGVEVTMIQGVLAPAPETPETETEPGLPPHNR